MARRPNDTVLVTCPHCVRTYTTHFYAWSYSRGMCEYCGDTLPRPDNELRREYLKVKSLLSQYKDDSFHYQMAMASLDRAMRCMLRLLKVETDG